MHGNTVSLTAPRTLVKTSLRRKPFPLDTLMPISNVQKLIRQIYLLLLSTLVKIA